MATVYRIPQYFRIWRLRIELPEYRNVTNPTLLVGQDSFFAGPGMGPEYDYPNPRGYQYPQDLRSFLLESNLPLFNSAPPVSLFNNYDWQNPRGYQYSTQLRTFTNNVQNQLASKDLFFGGPGQGPVYDWPNPLIKRLIPIDASLLPSPTGGPLGQLIQNPFSQNNWPNPRGFEFPRVLLNVIFYYVLDTSVPAVPFDWPNPQPRQAKFPYQATNPVIENLFGSTLFQGATAPQTNTEFPNPDGYRYPLALRTSIYNLLETTLDPGVIIPETPVTLDNPNGQVFAVSLRTYTYTLLQSTLAPIAISPFFGSTFGMPNPTLRVNYSQRSETSASAIGVPLVPPAAPNYFGGSMIMLMGVGH